MELLVLALIGDPLARYRARPGVEAGDIYGEINYVHIICCAMDYVPMLIQQLARLHDIGGRVALADGE